MSDIDESLHRKTVRASYATRVLILAVVIFAIAIIFLQLRVTTQTNDVTHRIADQQKVNTSNVETIKRIASQIESCTTPGQPCSERGRKQTATAVADINRVVVLAASCADKPEQQTEAQITQCVIAGLAKVNQRR